MSHELPGPGDFARVVSGCPNGCTGDCLGDVVMVMSVTGPDWACECPLCNQVFHGALAHAAGDPPDDCYLLAWLRKLPADRQMIEEIEREVVAA